MICNCRCCAYDSNGNTLADASGKSYTWNFENRLVQALSSRHRNYNVQIRPVRQANTEIWAARHHQLPL